MNERNMHVLQRATGAFDSITVSIYREADANRQPSESSPSPSLEEQILKCIKVEGLCTSTQRCIRISTAAAAQSSTLIGRKEGSRGLADVREAKRNIKAPLDTSSHPGAARSARVAASPPS